MNKIYTKVWNKNIGQLVVASEHARLSGGKSTGQKVVGGTTVMMALLLCAPAAWAGGGLQLCGQAADSTKGTSLGAGSSVTPSGAAAGTAPMSGGSQLNCTAGGTQGSYAFSLNNKGADTGGSGFGISTARVTGYDSGLLELRGDAGISMLGVVNMNSNKITGLGAGTISSTSTDAVNGAQLFNATRYFKASGLADGTDDASAIGANSIAIGASAKTGNTNAVSVGFNASTTGPGVAIGANTSASGGGGFGSVAIGNGASTTYGGNIALGDTATAGGGDTIAIGRLASTASIAGANGQIALGVNSSTSANVAIAIGSGANATAANSVALGAGSTTTATLSATGYNPGAGTLLGTASAANGEVSVGSAGKERRVTNVAAGSAGTDAVNVSQLQSEAAKSTKIGESTATALGGGATYGADGTITAPRYYVGGTIYNSVGAALTNLDGRTATNTTNIDTNTSDINSLKTGKVGLVQQSAAGANLTVGKNTDGAAVSVAGTAGNRVVTGVAAGAVDSNSTDAVNGSQLFNATRYLKVNGTNNGLDDAVAAGARAIAFGTSSSASGADSVAIGTNANVRSSTVAPGTSSMAIGYGANTGSGTDTGVLSAIALGTSARATADYAAAIGINAEATGRNSLAIGNSSTTTLATKASGQDATAVGAGSQASGMSTTAVGYQNKATNTQSTALGVVNTSSGYDSVAIGTTNTASAQSSVAIGVSNTASGQNSIALGRSSNASAINSIAQGNAASASGVSSTAIGAGAGALADSSLAIGVNAQATRDVVGRNGGIAIGTMATAGNNDSSNGNSAPAIAIGASARSDRNSVALGNGAQALNSAGLALGSMARVTADNAVSLGFGSTNDRASTVSVGAAGSERQIVNVAAATVDTDAVNLSQLKATAQGAATALGGGSVVNANGTITAPSYTVGGTSYNNVGEALGNIDGRTTINTTNIDNLQTTVDGHTTSINTLTTQINNGSLGLVQQDVDTLAITVAGDKGGNVVGFAAQGNVARTLTGVAAGALDSNSTDAVNGSQLFATNTRLDTAEGDIVALGGRVDGAEVNIGNLQEGLTSVEGNISEINTSISTLDGRVTTVDNRVTAVDNRVTAVDGRVTTVEGAVNTLTTQINGGSLGLVQQDADTLAITVAGDKGGNVVNFAAQGNVARTLTGVAVGAVDTNSTDAVNGSQLFATNTRLDTAEGNIVALDGRVDDAEGNIGNLQDGLASVEGNISEINDSISTVNTSINTLDGRMTTVDNRVTTVEGTVNNLSTQINSGALGLVQQDADTLAITVAGDKGGSVVNFAAQGGVARTLTGVSAGALSVGSKDAVNGSQLYDTNQKVGELDGRVAAVEGDISTLTESFNNGAVGLVKQDKDSREITVAEDKDGSQVNFAGTAGARVLEGVAAGTVNASSLQAVNGSQLYRVSQSVAAGLGGGSVVNTDGSISAPSYSVGGTTVNSVGAAIGNLDTRTLQNSNDIADLKNGIGSDVTEIKDRITTINNSVGGLDNRVTNLEQTITQGGFSDSGLVSANVEGVRQVAAASGSDSLTVGNAAAAEGESSTALGNNSQAKGNNSVALGNGSVADRDNSVSVGSQGNERQVTNVAAGTQDTDAVNVAQLNQRMASVNNYADTRVQALSDSFDMFKGEVDQRFANQDRRIDRQGAMSTAMMNMATSTAGIRTENRVGVGVGYQNGESALSVGYQRAISDRATITIGGAFSSNDRAIGAGAGFGW